jgi:hypothetical protein
MRVTPMHFNVSKHNFEKILGYLKLHITDFLEDICIFTLRPLQYVHGNLVTGKLSSVMDPKHSHALTLTRYFALY